MSLDHIENLIENIEAITEYPKVKEQARILLIKSQRLEKELSEKEEKIKTLSNNNDELDRDLNEKQNELNKMKETLKSVDDEAKILKSEIEKGKNQIEELTKFKATLDGKTVEEAKDLFLKAKDEEIMKGSEKLFEERQSLWERKEKPQEVRVEAVKSLRAIIGTLSSPGPKYYVEEIARNGLPEVVEDLLKTEVNRRIDAEFTNRVMAESEKKARERLDALEKDEWPKWFKFKTEPRINQLEALIQGNVLKMLGDAWDVRCNKCGTNFRISFNSEGISSLIKNGSVEIECQNPNCRDVPWATQRKHRFKISLTNLVDSYISESAQSG